jgi:hypothetical protein
MPADPEDDLDHEGKYYAVNTNTAADDCKIISKVVTVYVYDKVLPPTVTTPVEFCDKGGQYTLEDLAPYVMDTHIQWYADEEGEIPLDVTHVIETETIYWVARIVGGNCEGGRSFIYVTIDENIKVPAPDLDTIVLCQTMSGIKLTDLPVGELNLVWYTDAQGTLADINAQAFAPQSVFYAGQVVGDCESDELARVVIRFTPEFNIVPDIPDTLYFCDGAMIKDIIAPNYTVWYETETSTEQLPENYKLEDGESYWAAISYNDGDCESSARKKVVILIEPSIYDWPKETQEFCFGALGVHLKVQGYGVKWYKNEALTEELDLLERIEHDSTYYAANINEYCKLIALQVKVRLFENIQPPTVKTPVELCILPGGHNLTLADLAGYVQGEKIKWYATETSEEPLPLTHGLVDEGIYWVSQTLGAGCEGGRSYVKVKLTLNLDIPAPDIKSPIELCDNLERIFTLGDIPTGGLEVIWYSNILKELKLE